MPKKKLSDIVLHRIQPPDFKDDITIDDLAQVLVRRLGLQRKKSHANHAKLLVELMKFKKENTPVTIENISAILGVSISQTYEEIRKWRSMGMLEFTRVPMGFENIKGYMLADTTINRLLDRVESILKSFLRETRRIAKDFDDNFMLQSARESKDAKSDIEKELKEARKDLANNKIEEKQEAEDEAEEDKDIDEEIDESDEKAEKWQEPADSLNKEAESKKKSLFKEFGRT